MANIAVNSATYVPEVPAASPDRFPPYPPDARDNTDQFALALKARIADSEGSRRGRAAMMAGFLAIRRFIGLMYTGRRTNSFQLAARRFAEVASSSAPEDLIGQVSNAFASMEYYLGVDERNEFNLPPANIPG